MAVYYLDTSALVKYYIPETGSAWVRGLIDARIVEGEWQNVIAVAKVGIVEVAATTAKRQRMKDISESTQHHPLRGYDAIHLATALILNQGLVGGALPPLNFLSADRVLHKAARAEGLTAENPNEH